MKPRARITDVEQQWVDDELVVYDVKSGRAYCLNAIVAKVWPLADGTRDVPDLLEALRVDFPEATVTEVWSALDALGDANLLDERPAPPAGERRWSRRDLIREVAGATGALGIVSLSMPLPGAAQSGRGGDGEAQGKSGEFSEKEINAKTDQEQSHKESQNKGGGEQGSKEDGGKEDGGKEDGGKEHGNKGPGEQRNKEQGNKEQGNKEQGNKESGNKEHGNKEHGGKYGEDSRKGGDSGRGKRGRR
jgi:hypothetical protein